MMFTSLENRERSSPPRQRSKTFSGRYSMRRNSSERMRATICCPVAAIVYEPAYVAAFLIRLRMAKASSVSKSRLRLLPWTDRDDRFGDFEIGDRGRRA